MIICIIEMHSIKQFASVFVCLSSVCSLVPLSVSYVWGGKCVGVPGGGG